MARSGEPASVEVENLIITEVFVGNEARARGYVVTDKITDEFKYFIDVDRVIHKMTNVKIDGNEINIFDNIDDLPEYVITDEFDFIKVITNPIGTNPQPVFQRWRYEWGACGNGVQGQYKAWFCFGLQITNWEVSYGDDGRQVTRPC